MGAKEKPMDPKQLWLEPWPFSMGPKEFSSRPKEKSPCPKPFSSGPKPWARRSSRPPGRHHGLAQRHHRRGHDVPGATRSTERRQHMAVTGFSLSERFSRWQVLVNNLKEVGSNPHVADELAELEALLGEARPLQDKQEHFRAQAREVTKQLEAIAARGDNLRGRMGAVLQGKLGFTNEGLIRFGFKPRRPPRRRPKVTPPPETKAAPAAAGQAA